MIVLTLSRSEYSLVSDLSVLAPSSVDTQKMLPTIYLIAAFIYLFYKFWTINYDYWKKLGFPHIPGIFPFGSSTELVFQNNFQGEAWSEVYKRLSPHPFFGVYLMRTPFLVLRDPEAIRIVLAQAFHHFQDRQPFRRSREPLTNHLFNLEGEPWRALRVKLTSTFTSGKLKGMFPLFELCSEALETVLAGSVDQIIDVKDITARFSTDVIGTCAFGLEMKSIANPDSEFRKVGIEIFTPRRSTMYKMAIVNTFPTIVKLFSPRFTSKYVEKFILGAVKETIEYRTKHNVSRKDFIDLLIQLNSRVRESSNDFTELTMEMMAAQCFVFFTAGFETSASVQSCCLYELALNPDIQARLQDEICKVIEKYGITYDSISKMTYLDMVISETMRKYPTLPTLTRFSTQNLIMPSGHEVEKGTRVIIPVWALHRDPQYFPEPEKFDPERFSEENVSSIKPFTYLPFGEGPRMCIGKRFGLLQTKMGLITLLKNYTVEPSEDTPIPLKFSPSSLLITASDGPIPLRLTKRNKYVISYNCNNKTQCL